MARKQRKEMTRISSRWTFFYKRVFPAVWFGFLAIFVVVAFVALFAEQDRADHWIMFVVPGFMAIVGFVVMKQFVWCLADEVWDRGDSLVVKNWGREDRIALKEFMNLSYAGFSNPPRISLALRNPSELGTEITFMPPMRIFNFSMPPIARDLMVRIDEARSAAD